MSGTMQYSVNNYWSSTPNYIAPSVFFWVWLHYINDHPGMEFKGYGTGKSSSGITPPAAWLDWDPDTTPTPPMGNNSWFVFEAVNADNTLNGGGGNPWQAKIQFTNTSGFDDCNVANTDYGNEGTTYICCMRVSVTGGWDNDTDLEFEPTGGEDISENHALIYAPNDEKFVLDIIGDDDTFFWVGSCFDGIIATDYPARVKGGYLGMIQRRHSAVTYPFFFFARRLEDSTSYRFECYSSYPFSPPSVLLTWPNYPNFSLWKNKTKIEDHRIDSVDSSSRSRLNRDVLTGGFNIHGNLLMQEDADTDRYNIMGELRHLGSVYTDFEQGQLVGTNLDWKSFAYNVPTRPGMLMRWPAGVVPLWP